MTLPGSLVRSGSRFFQSTALGVLPYALDWLPRIYGGAMAFTSVTWFIVAFAACGMASGSLYGFWSLPAAVVAFWAGTAFLHAQGVLGYGGDGDLFYLLAFAGGLAFIVTALVATLVLKTSRRTD